MRRRACGAGAALPAAWAFLFLLLAGSVLAASAADAPAAPRAGDVFDDAAFGESQLADLFAALPAADEPPPLPPRRLFSAADARLRFLGRWDFSAGEALTGWSRGRLRLRVAGTAAVSLHCRLSAFDANGTWTDRPLLAMVRAVPLRLPAAFNSSWGTIAPACAPSHSQPGGAPAAPLATGLDPRAAYDLDVVFLFAGEVTVPGQRPLAVEAVGLDASLPSDLLAVPWQPVIEFVGDSITAGLSLAAGPDGTVQLASYADEAARILGAQAAVVALPGIGLVARQPPMRDAYFRGGLAPDSPRHDFAAQGYRPRAVVVNLGVNDRWQGVAPAEFAAAYRTLLSEMMRTYGRDNGTTYAVLVPFGRWHNDSREVLPVYDADVWRNISEGWPRRPKVIALDSGGWLTPFNAPRLLVDGVHPNPDGQLVFGARVAGELRRLLALEDRDPPRTSTRTRSRTRTRTATTSTTHKFTSSTTRTQSTSTTRTDRARASGRGSSSRTSKQTTGRRATVTTKRGSTGRRRTGRTSRGRETTARRNSTRGRTARTLRRAGSSSARARSTSRR
ncbi:hypothetical protein DFJ74DRAFT_744782 [Hyaloraphidium curvatum]|nr:hypothetical protein DFJ74DRAFT_744782 [Hyaloraphidium curvatum]